MQYNILSQEISPFVRFFNFYDHLEHFPKKLKCAYDYSLIYCISDSGSITIEERTYSVTPGTLFVIPPLTNYILHQMKSTSFFMANFDYLQNNANLTKPIPTISADKINPSLLHQKIHFTDLSILNTPFSLYLPGLEPYLQKCNQLFTNKDLYWQKESDLNFTKILLKIFKHLHYQHNSNNLVVQITNYIHEHFSENISNQQIAKTFGYHPNYLNRIFAEQTGIAIHKYLLNYRLDYAVRLFDTTNMSAIEIANAVGFKSLNYFSRIFKKNIGYNFSSYKK